MKRSNFTSIDQYISTFPKDVQRILKEMRKIIKKAAPEAEEKISYQIPTFAFHGNLVHFGAFKEHISFFPTSSGVKAFHKELSDYKISKGTIQFQLNKPIPYDLIAKIVKFRVRENQKRQKSKV